MGKADVGLGPQIDKLIFIQKYIIIRSSYEQRLVKSTLDLEVIMARKRTPEEIAELQEEATEMVKGGLSVAESASELGISETYLYQLLNRAGVKLPGWTGQRVTVLDLIADEVKEELVKVWLAKEMPVSVLLSRYGISYNTLYRILREQGVDVQAEVQVAEDMRAARMEQAIQMYLDGAKLWQIKAETGIHQPVLHAELHERGIELRRGNWKKRRGKGARDTNWSALAGTDPEP
jgi:transposase-like protein